MSSVYRPVLGSNFDCDYAFTLGGAAATLVHRHKSGYLATVTGLKNPVSEWKVSPWIYLPSSWDRYGVNDSSIFFSWQVQPTKGAFDSSLLLPSPPFFLFHLFVVASIRLHACGRWWLPMSST